MPCSSVPVNQYTARKLQFYERQPSESSSNLNNVLSHKRIEAGSRLVAEHQRRVSQDLSITTEKSHMKGEVLE